MPSGIKTQWMLFLFISEEKIEPKHRHAYIIYELQWNHDATYATACPRFVQSLSGRSSSLWYWYNKSDLLVVANCFLICNQVEVGQTYYHTLA